jgi:pSer/pThr/pTyr-binding forkhead associated (FHA) protein
VLKLIIEDDEGRKTVVPFVREEITIGRQEGNTIRLTERNVSRRHARLMRQNGHVVVEDLGSSNGTRINGERISGQSQIKDGDLIQIGDYDLALQSDAAAAAAAGATMPPRSRPAPAAEESSDSDGHSEPETEADTPVHEEEPASAQSAEQRRHSTAIIKMDQVEGNRNRKVQDIDAEEAPRLVVVSAELKGQEYACIRTEMKIGRTDDNDIVIDHRSLSRTHAKVVREDNGEWRILDMQSANGLTVNGESYAQAPLNNGDVVELGHVKLRFVAAGEAVGSISAGGSSKMIPIVAAVAVLLLGGGVGAAWALKVGPFKGAEVPPKGPEITHQDPTPPEPDPRQTTKPPEPGPGNDTPPPDTSMADAAKAHLQSAQKAYDEGSFDKAADELKNFNGKLPPEGEVLARKIASEQAASKALKAAKDAFKAKKLDEAEKLAEPAKDSEHFGQEYQELLASIEQERKPQQTKVETPKPPTNNTKPPQPDPAANNAELAKQAFTDAANLFRAQQYSEALNRANKCVELTPNNAECHMILGSAEAGLKHYDKAVEHYKRFLELAPDHRLAPRVRQTLENYSNTKSP